MENNNVTLVKITHHDLYKAVKNYLHNELRVTDKINDSYLNDLMAKVIEKRVNMLFADTSTIDRIIEHKIAEYIKNGKHDIYHRTNRSFGEIVLDQIKQAVRDQVMEKLAVQVSLDGTKLETKAKE